MNNISFPKINNILANSFTITPPSHKRPPTLPILLIKNRHKIWRIHLGILSLQCAFRWLERRRHIASVDVG